MSDRIKRDTRQLINQAWIRDDRHAITGEALLLACLLHTKGAGRKSKDMTDLQKIMRDHNLSEE